MHFSRKTIQDPDDPGCCIPIPKPDLILEGQTVKQVLSYKYLGILINSQLNWKEQAQRATTNATKWILQYRRLMKLATSVKLKLMRQLYLAVGLPKITYGINVWYTPLNRKEGQDKQSGSVTFLHNLTKIQQMAAHMMTGTLRTTPNNFVDTHMNLLPMELALAKACHRAAVQHLTLPDTNPIHDIIQEYRLNQPSEHLSSLQKLLNLFQLSEQHIETIKPTPYLLINKLQPTTFIDETRTKLIEAEEADNCNFKVFSDGSCQNDEVGAAAVLFCKNRPWPIKSLKNTWEATRTTTHLKPKQ